MKAFILVMIFACGEPDVVIIHDIENQRSTPFYDLRDYDTMEFIGRIMKTNPIVVGFEDDRSLCVKSSKSKLNQLPQLFDI